MYCSDRCKKRFQRISGTDRELSGTTDSGTDGTDKLSVPNGTDNPVIGTDNGTDKSSVTKMSADELYYAIHSYTGDSWKDSVEYKELMRRLEAWSIDELTGYWIPNWKQ